MATRKKAIAGTMAVTVSVALAASFSTPACARTWTYEFPDSSGGMSGLWASMKKDASGNLCVAYVGHSRLMYAVRNTSGVWSTEIVNAAAAGSGEAAQFCSIAVNGATPYIAYYDAKSRSLRCAHKSGSWVFETADSSVKVGAQTAIAVNSSGYPTIVYYDQTNNNLKVAYKDAGGWHADILDTSCGRYAAIAMDGSNVPHVAYVNSAGLLRHAWKSGAWSFETAGGADLVEDCGICIDNAGYPQIAYRQGWHGILKRAWKDGSGWHQEDADAAPKTGFLCSIGIASDGYPRITHFAMRGGNDGTNWWGMEIRFSKRTASSWTTTVVDKPISTNAGWALSAGFDHAGQPCFVYHYFLMKSLGFWRFDGSNWSQLTVDQGREVGEYASLVLDGANNPNIAYLNMDQGTPQFIKKSGGAWVGETIDSTVAASAYTSLKLLPSGYPAVAYDKWAFQGDDWHINSTLKYAYKDVGGWHPANVATTTGFYCSLGIYGGNPRIAYGSASAPGASTMYAEYSGSWSFTTVDPGQVPVDPNINWHSDGMWTSLAIDGSGNPHISYMENNEIYIPWATLTRKLMYARRVSGIWYIETVENDNCGKYSSIAVDASGYPRIAYQDVTNAVLKYAYKDASGWHIETVDNAIGTGFYCSLALNASGMPAIAYKEILSDTLRYAWRDGSGWHRETADSSGRVGNCASLALDSSGNPVIAYVDWSNLNLKVAYGGPSEGGSICGYVRDSGGQPISGASVCASPGSYCATTGQDGSYCLTDVPPATYSVTAAKAGYNSQTVNNVAVSTGQTVTANFSLTPTPPGTITGYVRDSSSNPISQAVVTASPGGFTAQTGTNGSYSLSVSPNTYSVTASKTGYNSQTQNNITVNSGQTVTVNFTLSTPSVGTIAGRVKDTSGNGISGVSVSTDRGGYAAVTQSDGTYSIPNVAPDVYNVTASKTGYISQTLSYRTVTVGQTTYVYFFLPPVCSSRLTNGDFESGFTSGIGNNWSTWKSSWSATINYLDSTDVFYGGVHAQKWGKSTDVPIHGGLMQAVSVTSGQTYLLTAWVRFTSTDGTAWIEVGYDLTGQTSNGEAGTINYTKLESGGQNKWLAYSKAFTAAGPTVSVWLKFGHQYQVGGGPCYAWADDVVLCASTGLGSIGGYVKDSSRNPISGATVTAGSYSATTESDGGYFIPNVTPATYSVTASKAGYNSFTQTNKTVSVGQTTQANFTLTGGPAPFTRVAAVKQQPDGTYVSLSTAVCSRRPSADLMFVQDADRSAGIKLTKGTGTIPTVTPGTVCTVVGRLQTVNNVREITDVSITAGTSGAGPAPVAMPNRAVGGYEFAYSAGPPVRGQIGRAGSYGANNVGLLVKTWGRVLDTASGGVFHVSDGSAVGGMPVKLLTGVTAPTQNQYITVIGIPEPDGLLVVQSSDWTAL